MRRPHNYCKLTTARTDETGRKIAVFSFSKAGFGFGEIAVITMPNGQSFVDMEYMGRKKTLEMFELLLYSSICEVDKDPDKHSEFKKAMGIISCGCCGHNEEDK